MMHPDLLPMEETTLPDQPERDYDSAGDAMNDHQRLFGCLIPSNYLLLLVLLLITAVKLKGRTS